jgi:hypothetical protein
LARVAASLRTWIFPTAMAENIYSKGTQVWFPDKELSWISGEVTSATRNADDTVKLVFVDERGKVRLRTSCCKNILMYLCKIDD